MLEGLMTRVWALLLEVSLKSLLVLVMAGLVLLCLRRASAAVRHLVLLVTLGALLLLPLFSATLPGLRITSWPQVASAAPPVADPGIAPPATVPANEAMPLLSAPSAASATQKDIARLPVHSDRLNFSRPLFGVIVWAIGVCVVLALVLAGMAGVQRIGCRSDPVTALSLTKLATDLGHRLGLRRHVSLRCGRDGDKSAVPMTWGWRRPVISLPSGTEEWPEERLRVVLLHEMAHIRRCDWLWQMLAHGMCALYWFHPGVWMIARRLRMESERACDDEVLSSGVPAPDYARHLLDVARTLAAARMSPNVALPMAEMSQIENRIRNMLHGRKERIMVTSRSIWIGMGAAFVLLLPLAALQPAGGSQESAAIASKVPVKKPFIVVVDPGHGGQDTGAVGLDGTLEKHIDLAIALKLHDALINQGTNVYLTRTGDTFVPLPARPALAKSTDARCFVSIHCGLADKESGTKVYYHGQSVAGRRFATNIADSLRQASALPPVTIHSDTEQFPMGYAVLRGSPVPAVLVECGFLNNTHDLAALRQAETQQRIADGVASGLEDFAAQQAQTKRNAAVSATHALPSEEDANGAHTDPAAVLLLRQMTETYKALRTYSGTELAEGDGALGMPYRLDLAYAQPGKLAFTHTRSFGPQTITHHILLDGKTLFETSSNDAPGRYARLTKPQTNYNLWQEAFIIRCDVKFPIIMQLLEDSDNVFQKLGRDPHTVASLGQPGRIDGVTVDAVILTSHGPSGDGTTVMRIGHDDHLLRQITETMGPESDEKPKTITQTFSHVQANPALPASTFVFTAAVGAIAVDVDPGGAHADPAAVALMARMYAASAALQSCSFTRTTEVTGIDVASGKTSQSAISQATFAIQKPARVAMMRQSQEGEARATADGANLYVTTTESSSQTQALPGRYLKLPVGPNDPNRLLWLSRFGNLPQYWPDQDFMPNVILGFRTMPAEGYDWKMGEPGVVNGEPVDTVTLQRGEGTSDRYDLLTLAISHRDHLLRQVSEAQDARHPSSAQTETYTDIQKNPALPASLFVFTPPPGSTPVATTDELFGKR